ncbi:MAG: hypothetical protein QM749_09210 [Aquabacterium sp.]
MAEVVVPPMRVVLDPGLATIARGHVREGDAPTLYLHAPDAKPPRGFDRANTSRCRSHGLRPRLPW